MIDASKIGKTFLPLLTAAFVLTAAHAVHPAEKAEPKQENRAAGDRSRREVELRNALKTNPNDAEAHFQLGQIYMEMGDWRAAATEFKAARGSNVPDGDLDAKLAWAWYLQGDFDALFREIKPGQRNATAESVVRMSLGLGHLNQFDFGSAEDLLRDAVRLDPGYWRPHLYLARVLILTRKLPEAREQLDLARNMAPNEVAVTRITGELLRAEGDVAGAIEVFSKVLQGDPFSVPARAGRADALISEDKLADAERDVNQLLKISKQPETVFLSALVLARKDRLAEADDALMNISSRFDRMPIGYYLAGVTRYKRGLTGSADDYLAKFQGKQPNVSGATRLRAEMAIDRKDPTSAIALLASLVKTNPADHAAVATLARAYLASGQSEQILGLFEEVATAPPKAVASPSAAGLLMMYGDAVGDLVEIEKVLMTKTPDVAVAMSDLRQGNFGDAERIAETLAANSPNDPVVQNLLGEVRLAQRRLPEAETVFRLVLNQNRDFMPAALNLVEVLVAQKRLDDARSMLRDLMHRS